MTGDVVERGEDQAPLTTPRPYHGYIRDCLWCELAVPRGTPTVDKEISICCLIPRRPKEASSLGTRRAGCQEELSSISACVYQPKSRFERCSHPFSDALEGWVLGNSAPGRMEGCHHFSPAGTRISTSNRRRAKTAPHCDAGMSSSWFSSCSRVARPARRLRCSLPSRPERTLRRRASLAT